MKQTKAILTKHVGFRLRPSTFDQLQLLADKAGKPVNDWCREVVLQCTKRAPASPTEFAVMAEIAATQAISIEMLCAVGSGGKPPPRRPRRVDKAHHEKCKESLNSPNA